MNVLIAIDAGHGRYSSGKRCLKTLDPNETREWVLNDRVGRYLQERAAAYEGFNILRVDDPTGTVDVQLAERCRRANAAKADFFISLHHNAGANGTAAGGLVAYSYIGSEKGAQWRDALYDAVLAAGKLRGNRANPKVEANHAVTRQTNMPAVLIEHGFMDSSVDVPIILSEAYAKACGYAEADCIAEKFGLKLKNVPDPEDPTEGASDWAKEACAWAAENGIVSGDGKGNFNWKRQLTLEEICVLLRQLHG